jgi:hypothetical protein
MDSAECAKSQALVNSFKRKQNGETATCNEKYESRWEIIPCGLFRYNTTAKYSQI